MMKVDFDVEPIESVLVSLAIESENLVYDRATVSWLLKLPSLYYRDLLVLRLHGQELLRIPWPDELTLDEALLAWGRSLRREEE